MFPRHDISPLEKDKDWIKQCAQAIMTDWRAAQTSIFSSKTAEYNRIDTYILGEQDITNYKKRLGWPIDEFGKCEDQSLINIDWTNRPIVSKLRSIALKRIAGRDYNFVCTPIDPLAKDEADNYFNDIKAKLLLREAMQKVAPDLVDSPALTMVPGEPADLEELEIKRTYGFKTSMAMEAEMAIQLILYKNDYQQIKRTNEENLFDYGVSGVKEWIDENGDVRVRPCTPKNVVMSFCRNRDFSDMTYCGELVEVPLSELSTKFDPTEMEALISIAKTRNTNSGNVGRFNEAYDEFKVEVLDFEIISWNDTIYQQKLDGRGNLAIRVKAFDPKYKNSDEKTVMLNGDEIPKYITKSKEVIYKGKWIVNSELIYDYGLATNMKRSKPNRARTQLSYHFMAYQFKDMKCIGKMESLIPIIDEYQETILRLQHFKNKWIPYLIEIDLEAIENVSLGSGGKAMTPKEILDMAYQNFTLITRKSDMSGTNVNAKSMNIVPTGMASEYNVLLNDLSRLLAEMRDMIGLNEVTDGSTPNPNLLNYVASLGSESTNNALSPLMDASKKLGEKLAQGVARRMVQAVKHKKLDGLLPALGQESMQFISVSPDISLHDWGIMVEDRPTIEERNLLIQQMTAKEANGIIDPEDYLIIMETQNLKQARALLAYRLKKRKREAEQYELQKMQMNGQIQQQSTMTAHQAKIAEIDAEYKAKAALELELKRLDMQMLQMKLQSAEAVNAQKSQEKRMSESSTSPRV